MAWPTQRLGHWEPDGEHQLEVTLAYDYLLDTDLTWIVGLLRKAARDAVRSRVPWGREQYDEPAPRLVIGRTREGSLTLVVVAVAFAKGMGMAAGAITMHALYAALQRRIKALPRVSRLNLFEVKVELKRKGATPKDPPIEFFVIETRR